MKKLLIFLYLAGICPLAALAQTDHALQNNNTGVSRFPNLHPLFVHFPLILLLVAAIMQIALLFMHNKAYNIAVTIITVVGFIMALLASFVFHAHISQNANPEAREIFETHEHFAMITLWLSGIASVFKIAGVLMKRKWVEVIAFLFLVGSSVTVLIAGQRGSELVYKQSVGPEGNKLEKEEH